MKAMMHWLPILWHHIMALAPGGKVGTGHPGSDGQENNEAERAVLGLLNLTARCVKQVTEAMPDTRLDLTFIDTTDTTDFTDATYASGAPAPDSLPASASSRSSIPGSSDEAMDVAVVAVPKISELMQAGGLLGLGHEVEVRSMDMLLVFLREPVRGPLSIRRPPGYHPLPKCCRLSIRRPLGDHPHPRPFPYLHRTRNPEVRVSTPPRAGAPRAG